MSTEEKDTKGGEAKELFTILSYNDTTGKVSVYMVNPDFADKVREAKGWPAGEGIADIGAGKDDYPVCNYVIQALKLKQHLDDIQNGIMREED